MTVSSSRSIPVPTKGNGQAVRIATRHPTTSQVLPALAVMPTIRLPQTAIMAMLAVTVTTVQLVIDAIPLVERGIISAVEEMSQYYAHFYQYALYLL